MANKHICKNPSCGKQFSYCRACIFKPIYYHEAGFCSKDCLTEYRTGKSKTEVEILKEESVIEEVQPIAEETPIQEEVVSDEDNTVTEESTIVEEVTPTVDETTETESTYQKETYAYYKKKKHKVHE